MRSLSFKNTGAFATSSLKLRLTVKPVHQFCEPVTGKGQALAGRLLRVINIVGGWLAADLYILKAKIPRSLIAFFNPLVGEHNLFPGRVRVGRKCFHHLAGISPDLLLLVFEVPFWWAL